MNSKKIVTTCLLLAVLFLVTNTTSVAAIDLDPGDSYVYGDITVKFQRLRCFRDTDVRAAAGGADVWLRITGEGITTDKKPVLNELISGYEGSGGLLVPPYPEAEITGSPWNYQYFTTTFYNVLLDGDTVFTLYVYDADAFGTDLVVSCTLTIKSMVTVISPRSYNNIYAYATGGSTPLGYWFSASGFEDSYIRYWWTGGAYYPGGDPISGYTTNYYNGLYIDTSIVYHV